MSHLSPPPLDTRIYSVNGYSIASYQLSAIATGIIGCDSAMRVMEAAVRSGAWYGVYLKQA